MREMVINTLNAYDTLNKIYVKRNRGNLTFTRTYTTSEWLKCIHNACVHCLQSMSAGYSKFQKSFFAGRFKCKTLGSDLNLTSICPGIDLDIIFEHF